MVIARCAASTPKKPSRTAVYLPQTYWPGVSGVECRIGPILCSSSRMKIIPAAIEAKNE